MSSPACYYYIKSHLNGLYVNLDYAKTNPGALLSMWKKKDSNAQQWWDDPATGTIRSKLNGFCLDIKDGRIVLNPYQPGAADQLWERRGTMIVDSANPDMCLDVYGKYKEPGTKLIKYKRKATGYENQDWTFELA